MSIASLDFNYKKAIDCLCQQYSPLFRKIAIEPNSPQLSRQHQRIQTLVLYRSMQKTSLTEITLKHRALEVYDSIKIQAKKTLVLATTVFDGIGDLEHLMTALRHLSKFSKNEGFRLSIWIERDNQVPDKAWEYKIEKLRGLGVKEEDIFIQDNLNSDPEVLKKDLERINDITEKSKEGSFCIVFISLGMAIPFIGHIEEYGGEWGNTDLAHMPTGFQSGTFGIWLKDDPVFASSTATLSTATTKLLFGTLVSRKEMKNWCVGFASLREDKNRFLWIELRLGQVERGKNCALVLSSFTNPHAAQPRLLALAKSHGFSRCIVVDENNRESVLTLSKQGPTFRVINRYISEQDLPGVIRLAKRGSLGGAGDTAMIRGLIGTLPPFLEYRKETSSSWVIASQYMKSKGFLRLAAWFNLCNNERLLSSQLLSTCMTPQLKREWIIFRSLSMEQLDMGSWVNRYIRRCLFAAGEDRQEEIAVIEKKFLQEKLSFKQYESKIRSLQNKNLSE